MVDPSIYALPCPCHAVTPWIYHGGSVDPRTTMSLSPVHRGSTMVNPSIHEPRMSPFTVDRPWSICPIRRYESTRYNRRQTVDQKLIFLKIPLPLPIKMFMIRISCCEKSHHGTNTKWERVMVDFSHPWQSFSLLSLLLQ